MLQEFARGTSSNRFGLQHTRQAAKATAQVISNFFSAKDMFHACVEDWQISEGKSGTHTHTHALIETDAYTPEGGASGNHGSPADSGYPRRSADL